MPTRYIALRLVEWRANWFSDPAKRLRFLKHSRSRSHQLLPSALLVALTLGLASASIAFVKPGWRRTPPPPRPIEARISAPSKAPDPASVWPVESNERFDLYSNGLRVKNQYPRHTRSRAYLAYARDRFDPRLATLRLDPAGIVYHTTESHMAPFEERQN